MTVRPSTRWDVLMLVALGGSLGAGARFGLSELLPHRGDQFPWATLMVNGTGCFALGVLMVLALELWSSSRYLRPLLGVGFLGGYTTFSAYALETRELLAAGAPGLAGSYLLGSVVVGLVAVWTGLLTGRIVLAATVRGGRHAARGAPSAPPAEAPVHQPEELR